MAKTGQAPLSELGDMADRLAARLEDLTHEANELTRRVEKLEAKEKDGGEDA